MQFPYKKVPSTDKPQAPWVPMPIIKIRLSNNERRIQLEALIDSGANVSLFHASVATALGIDLKTGLKSEFFGVSGHGIDVYFHEVDLQVVGSPTAIKLAVGFTESPGVGALLGQADFFQHHQIKFERYKERIEINPMKQ
jgi:hypothetical protein